MQIFIYLLYIIIYYLYLYKIDSLSIDLYIQYYIFDIKQLIN